MTLILGDAREKLKDLVDASVDLVYLDPPYYTQRTHTLRTRDNSKEYSFEDTWLSIQEYCNFIKAVLLECARILKPTGSIFLHCDKSASHHLRLLLDEVFGRDNFQSEIIWAYRRWSNSKKGLLNSHQTIYFYSKTANFQFNSIYTGYSPTTNLDQILQERVRDKNGKTVYKYDEHGEVVWGGQKKGVPLSDVWNIPYLNPKATERTGYPTQKPILLLEQIIKLCTVEGDLVLDPFCGSGTTLVAARLLNRQFVGIETSKDAIELTQARLQILAKSKSFLLERGESDYLEKTETELAILKVIGAIPVQRNKGIDGFLTRYHEGRPVAVKIQKAVESLQEARQKLLTASKAKNCSLAVLVRTHALEEKSIWSGYYEQEVQGSLLIIDCFDFLVESWLSSQVRQEKI